MYIIHPRILNIMLNEWIYVIQIVSKQLELDAHGLKNNVIIITYFNLVESQNRYKLCK